MVAAEVATRLDTALALARRGMHIFPVCFPLDGRCSCGEPACPSPAKHPIGCLAPHGLKDATSDSAIVAAWWRSEPRANIGIATEASGLVVIDIDPRHGGDDALVALQRDSGCDLSWATVKTGSGGGHLYFQANGTRIKSRRLPGYLGIDIKHAGGYVLAAGSENMAGRYTWAGSSAQPIPSALLAILTREPAREAHTRATGALIPEGQRNEALTSKAGVLRHVGLSEPAIGAALAVINVESCVPPLPSSEVASIAHSIAKYEASTELTHDKARRVQLTPASTITMRPVKWLWDGRCPLGSFGLLGGREGIGKSTVAYTLAAAITQGTLAGAHLGDPRGVLVAATEDSWAHTICPRLAAAGANLDLVYRVDVMEGDTELGLVLPKDIGALKVQIESVGAAMLILDPLLSRLDAGLDSHKDAEVRRALEPLTRLADETGAFVLGLIHVNKSQSSDALTLLMGSRAFAAVARSVLFVMVDPDDENIRLLGLAKNNLGRLDIPALKFKIGGAYVADTAEGPVWSNRIEWLGDAERSLRDAIETAGENGADRSAVVDAAEWLRDFLAGRGGSCPSAVVKTEGKAVGHSASALKRARGRLKVRIENRGYPKTSTWVTGTSGATSLFVGPTDPTDPTEVVGLGETT